MKQFYLLYSQCRLDGFDYSFSARNMGKNDIWIAATARVLGATLLTTDKDFNHLLPNLLNLKCLKSEL
jgi:tRNA(fMet)-specific endonuclease VapC